VVGPGQVAADGVRGGVAVPLDRLTRCLLLQAAPRATPRARLHLESALLLRQQPRLLVGGVAVEVVGVRQRQGAWPWAGGRPLALASRGGQRVDEAGLNCDRER